MRFEVRLHNKIPEGFVMLDPVYDRRNEDYAPKIQSTYAPSDSHIKMYGLHGDLMASLKTEYEDKRRLLGRRISNQTAGISLGFNTTFEGYEKTASQVADETMDSSSDPEKVATALKIYEALKERLKNRGYEFNINRTKTPFISIRLGDQHGDPFREFSAIFRELKEIEAAYERGEKPLGEIEEPTGTIKLNQRHRVEAKIAEGIAEQTKAKASEEKWQQLMQQRMVQEITALTSKYFPVGGAPVTQQQHQLFESELRNFLSRSK